MFNPEIQYRCTIIRGKAQKDLDNLLPNYSNFINETCPIDKESFNNGFNDYLSNIFYETDYENLSKNHQKTVRNHITEIAGKLFGLYYEKKDLVLESESCAKLVEDNDQPAFFKNLCLNFQFPNGTQKIQTIEERIKNQIKLKPFHFVLTTLKLAKVEKVVLSKDEIAYYILNAKEVLQGKVLPKEVLQIILDRRVKGIDKKLEASSFNTQHIREQLNLLELANLIRVNGNNVYLNSLEHIAIELFTKALNEPLSFNIYDYNLSIKSEKERMYEDWSEFFGKVNVSNYNLLSTSIEALQQKEEEPVKEKKKELTKQF